MNRPFRRRVTLSEEERLKFEELVKGIEPDRSGATGSGHPGKMTRLRATFRRHRVIAILLVPVGLLTMMMAVATWWPLGALGVALLGVGVLATIDLLGDALKRGGRSEGDPGSGRPSGKPAGS
ncbi:MAG: hypothetical protein ACR2QO_04495 [Acidimicrobiales bacterium]